MKIENVLSALPRLTEVMTVGLDKVSRESMNLLPEGHA